MTDFVYLVMLCAVTAALVKRPGWVSIVLAAHFGGCVLLADLTEGGDLRSVLMGADGLVAVLMWLLWRIYRMERAAIIAGLGFLKISFGVACAIGDASWLTWAAANNAIFLVQVLIAGGFLNGFMAWLGRSHHGPDSRGRGLLGYLERLP